jgi:hypothetical protein
MTTARIGGYSVCLLIVLTASACSSVAPACVPVDDHIAFGCIGTKVVPRT